MKKTLTTVSGNSNEVQNRWEEKSYTGGKPIQVVNTSWLSTMIYNFHHA